VDLQENDDLAQAIAHNGFEFIKNHLRMTDVAEYWRNLLQQYAELQQWETELDDDLVPVTRISSRG
jgi:hypothetical protein